MKRKRQKRYKYVRSLMFDVSNKFCIFLEPRRILSKPAAYQAGINSCGIYFLAGLIKTNRHHPGFSLTPFINISSLFNIHPTWLLTCLPCYTFLKCVSDMLMARLSRLTGKAGQRPSSQQLARQITRPIMDLYMCHWGHWGQSAENEAILVLMRPYRCR